MGECCRGKKLGSRGRVLEWSFMTSVRCKYKYKIHFQFEKPAWQQLRKEGLTPVVVVCNMNLSCDPPCTCQCFKRRKVCVMLQCFPALIISKLSPVSCCMLASQDLLISKFCPTCPNDISIDSSRLLEHYPKPPLDLLPGYLYFKCPIESKSDHIPTPCRYISSLIFMKIGMGTLKNIPPW
jgi:hypothetical protein